MLLVAPGLATRNKRPLEPKASPLIENEEAGMRKIEAGGHATRLQTVSNKAMQSGGISSLASWTYLQFSFSEWHEAKPRTS